MNSDFDDESDDDEEGEPFDSEEYNFFLQLEEARKEIRDQDSEINRLQKEVSELRTEESKLTTELYKLKRLAVTMLRSIREYERTTE